MKRKNEIQLRATLRKATTSLTEMQRELIEVGLIATAASINEATKTIGYEAAKLLERKR